MSRQLFVTQQSVVWRQQFSSPDVPGDARNWTWELLHAKNACTLLLSFPSQSFPICAVSSEENLGNRVTIFSVLCCQCTAFPELCAAVTSSVASMFPNNHGESRLKTHCWGTNTSPYFASKYCSGLSEHVSTHAVNTNRPQKYICMKYT